MNNISVSRASNSAANFFKISASALIAITVLTCSATLFAAPANNQTQFGAENSKNHKKQTEKQTLALASMMSDYRQATKPNKQNMKRELITLATERQALLAELIATDPAAAVRAVLPASVRKGMPEDIKAMLAEKRELKGELEVIYEDHDDESQSRLRHMLITDAGRVELHLPENAKATALQTGAKVRAKGWLFNDSQQDGKNSTDLVLSDEPESLMQLADGGGSTTMATTAASNTATLANTLGEQRTLVILVNFQDNTTQPWTIAQTQELVFGNVNDYYLEVSYGQAWLTGEVQGYYTLPINATCNINAIDNYGRQAVKDSGIDVDSYDRWVYIYPQNTACGWTGQGTVGGSPSRTFINGAFTLNTIGHELGHNFGLHHAKDLDCSDGVQTGRCLSFEYGDTLDIMGKQGVNGHFNAFSKQKLGWITPAAGEIVTADSDGIYQIEPYESAPAGAAKGLKVRRGTDANTGQPLWYYLEYRQAIGFDSFLEGKSGIADGVVLHLATENDMKSNLLLDMTPNSDIYDYDDAALLTGSSYTDADTGVTITTEWADVTGASVNVSYSGQSCVKAGPSLSLLPNESAWVVAGSVVTYSATVINNDSAECTASGFDIAAAVPSGWATGNQSLNLAPGASGTVTLNVTSTDAAADGFYDVTISAKNSADSQYQNSGVVSYIIDTPIENCILANPSFTLVNNSSELAPGSTATYSGTLVNQNSSACSSADFDINATVLTDWIADNSSVNLASGESASVNLNVTSPDSAADGFYAFEVSAQNRVDSDYGSSLVASYTVVSPLPICVASAPLIVVSNKDGSEVATGTQVNYRATITNQDGESCAEVGFDVSADVPVGWSTSMTNVKLMPGASTVVDIKVASDVAAAEGLYNFSINAQNSSDSSHSSNDTVSYSVAALINTAPIANNDSVIMSAKEAIVIDVQGNDLDPENDVLTIVAVSQGAKGNVQITSDGQVLYTPAKSFKSSDSFSYTISDGDKTATASVSLSLSGSSGGNSNGNGKGK